VRTRRIAGPLLGVVAVTTAALLGVGSTPAVAATANHRITVSATGKVQGTPDVADVTIGVSARAKTASEALDTANDRANKVIGALKDGGVDADDVQTSGLSIQPTYATNGDITGYQVDNTVTARLRDLSKAGALLDATARVAGDEVRLQGISFSVDDDSALLATARTRAVKRAHTQAQQLADAAGVSLGSVVSIDEQNVAIPYPRASTAGAADAASSIPIEPGTQTLTVSVSVVYAIA